MKNLAFLIVLASFNLFLHAQDNGENIKKFIITYSGDSTLFTEKYEIDLNKKKIYYITPIINYLDVKGEKYRTKIKIKKHEWEEITQLIKNLSSSTLNCLEKSIDGKIIYSFEVHSNDKLTKECIFKNEQIPSDLKRIFAIIRE